MPNWWENYYGLDPEDAEGNNGPHGDQDGDFLTNYAEHLASANPQKYSTAGNGVPDYQIPIWYRRGTPTFGVLYTDNDFMEDHWEAVNRATRLTVDQHDAYADADGDGWSNWAEARANFRTGKHSTNPNAITSMSASQAIQLEMPTPALRLTVDYFGDQNVYTNATAEAKIIVHSYTAKANNSDPDAVFELPLVTNAAAEGATGLTNSAEIGAWKPGIMSGHLHIGNIVPGSLRMKFTRRYDGNGSEQDSTSGVAEFNILSDTEVVGDVAELYTMMPVDLLDDTGAVVGTGYEREFAGSVNYRTGEYTLDFTDETVWFRTGYVTDENGVVTEYDRTEFVGVATYSYGVIPGTSNTFTLVTPRSGYLREGANNFFVFADLNGNATWDDREPAGVTDQRDVEIGFDQVNEILHVALTEQAPPGTVRVDLSSILGVLTTENTFNTAIQGDTSSLINPTTGDPLQPSLFTATANYWVVLREFERIGTSTQAENPGSEVYRRQFNKKKPYITEAEIFGNEATRNGLPGSEAVNQVAASYKVYLLPETVLTSAEVWHHYNISVVTNIYGMLDKPSTSPVAPQGGTYLTNSDLVFEWKSNVQVPTFELTITKIADGAGNPTNAIVYSNKEIRGVAPSAMSKGTGSVEQFVYRYKLPRGIGELNAESSALFGDGAYTYALTLKPYSGDDVTFEGKFNVQMNASGDANLSEIEGAVKDTSFNAQDSYYVRANIRYNGVLSTTEDFNLRKIVVEAHYSGSFNGNPVASTSDILVYDEESAKSAALNRCVKMVKDTISSDQRFFSTRFDVELRGLATNRPVYLMAYLDLNGNGKRDVWEPWGYATQGLDSASGFYFDPLAVTPQASGTAWNAEFYIQDVDADSDKLSDAWEWRQNGNSATTGSFFDDGTANSGWCNTYGGALGDLTKSMAIWTKDEFNKTALTAYGAQLYGLNVVGTPDANGAVKIEGVEDMAAAKELIELLGDDVALDLIKDGYSSYGLAVNSITFTGDSIALTWAVESAVMADGSVYDLTEVFAEGKNYKAVYSVYGTDKIGGTWTKIKDVQVSGALTPSINVPVAETILNGTEQATFFKVILSATPMETVLE
jgi:hypothetical protein